MANPTTSPPSKKKIYFLRKYECQAVLEQIKTLVLLPSTLLVAENFARLLIAMHLDLPEVVATMIERNSMVFKWLLPSNSASHRSEFVDYAAFKYMLRQYVWALISADISNPGIMTIVRSGDVKDVPRWERSLRFLTEAKEVLYDEAHERGAAVLNLYREPMQVRWRAHVKRLIQQGSLYMEGRLKCRGFR